MSENPLKSEFQYYLDHQSDMVEKYNGRYVVIKNGQVIGVYDDQFTAVNETQKKHQLGSFLVQMVSPGKAAYTQTFHSRAAFR